MDNEVFVDVSELSQKVLGEKRRKEVMGHMTTANFASARQFVTRNRINS